MLRNYMYDRFAVTKNDDKNDVRPFKITVIKGATKGFVWELTQREYISFLENILEEKGIIDDVERDSYD